MKLRILLIVSGIAAGLLQCCVNLPPLVLLIYIPAFYSVFSEQHILSGKLSWIKSWHIVVFFAQLTSCSFLVTIYKLMPIPVAVSIPLAAISTLALGLWLTILTCAPIIFLSTIKSHGLWDVFSFSILFIIGEWLCENVVVISFPWSPVSLSVVNWNEFVQSASVLGSKFTSLIILIINGFLAYALFHKITIRQRLACAMSAVLCLSATVFYGKNHILYLENKIYESGKPLNVLVAQDNIEGKEKSKIEAIEATKSYISILNSDWAKYTDLILLPETAVPQRYDDNADEFSALVDLAEEKDVIICAGAFRNSDSKTYNALYAITADGAIEQPYLKQILVPFGEKVPFAELFGASTLTSCTDEQFTQPIETDDYSIGCGICIESIYPSVLRQQAEQGGEFFVIPTNDSWFGKSFARFAHYRHSIMRSVENERFTLRSGNCGISAVITPWGGESAAIKTPEKGVIASQITALKSQSIYTQMGDGMLIAMCILYLASRFFVENIKHDLSKPNLI